MEYTVIEGLERYNPELRENTELMSRLEELSRGKESRELGLEVIDAGTSTTITRLGQLKSGLWIATREAMYDGIINRNISEEYRFLVEDSIKKGEETPILVAGVENENNDKYFLVVEDLTEGGKYDFRDITKDNRDKESALIGDRRVTYDYCLSGYPDPEEFVIMEGPYTISFD